MKFVYATLIVSLLVSASRAAEVPADAVHFQIDHVTTFGDSVFILGDIPELGGGDVRRAVKLIPGQFTPGSLPWSIDVAIPQGTTYTFRFLTRNDAAAAVGNPANGTFISDPVTASTTTPMPPLRDRTIFIHTAVTATSATFELPDGPFARPFIPVPGSADHRVATVYDLANGPGLDALVSNTTIDTPLHVAFYRSGSVYNYVPPGIPNQAGSRETFALPTALIPATRTIDGVSGRGIEVWLPRGYNRHTDKRYPVLYMHDGQNIFLPGGPFGSWQAEIVAAQVIQRAGVRELIIVGIDNSPQRAAEYVPEFGNATVDNARYNQFIVSELKPAIDARYRTLTGPSDTGIAGSSFGGIASGSLALDYPDVFGRVGMFSPSFWASNVAYRVGYGEIPLSTRVYLDAGDTNDGGDDCLLVRDGLLSFGRTLCGDFFFQIGIGHQHNEAAWSARLPLALEALFPITDEPVQIALVAPLRGDLDGGGCVNLSDLARLLAAFGACESDAAHDAAVDIDASRCVDLSDLAQLLARFGSCL